MNLPRVLSFALLLLAPAVAQDDAPQRRPFCRYVAADDGGRMEVLFATYRKGGRQLTLYAAFHIADREYYDDLQRRFEQHDVLLYELIAEPDLRPYPGMEEGDGGWIGMVQDGMGNGLKLQAQFECLDYRPDNFVHADMTDVEWYDALDEAGSSEFGELMLGGDAERGVDEPRHEVDLVDAFRNGRGTAEMRIMMARDLTRPDRPSDEPTVIIHGRNERCLEVLERELANGHETLGIFYGAAHMEHMERRLVEDLGWQLVGEEWALCWDCRYSRFPKVEKGLKQKRWRAKRDVEKLQAAVDEWRAGHEGEQATWAKLRAAQDDGELPGRNDGVDPWGREYVLVEADGVVRVVCLGSDGEALTADDLMHEAAPDGFFEQARKLRAREREWRAKFEAASEEHEAARKALGLELEKTTFEEALRRAKAANESLAVEVEALRSGEPGPRTSSSDLAEAKRANDAAAERSVEAQRRRAALQYAVDLWCAQHPSETPTWDAIRSLHPHQNLPVRSGTKDPWGNDYALRASPLVGHTVRSAGPDGKFDTDDDL